MQTCHKAYTLYSVPSSIAVIGDRISPAIGENCKVGITVNGSSIVCFSSPLKTLFLCGTFWGNFKIVNGHNNNRDR